MTNHRPFAEVLEDINYGEFTEHLGADMAELVQDVRETGRKGTLTIQIAVSPRKGTGRALNVTASRVIKRPAAEPAESVFFADDAGNLMRDDPRQTALPLRQLDDDGPAPLRTVGR
jgi:hypothetical protein